MHRVPISPGVKLAPPTAEALEGDFLPAPAPSLYSLVQGRWLLPSCKVTSSLSKFHVTCLIAVSNPPPPFCEAATDCLVVVVVCFFCIWGAEQDNWASLSMDTWGAMYHFNLPNTGAESCHMLIWLFYERRTWALSDGCLFPLKTVKMVNAWGDRQNVQWEWGISDVPVQVPLTRP